MQREVVVRTASTSHDDAVEVVEVAALTELLIEIRALGQRLIRIEGKVNKIMAAQDDVDAAVAAIQAENQEVANALTALAQQSADLTAAEQRIQDAMTALQQQNPSVDTTALANAVGGINSGGLDSAVSSLATAVQGVDSLAPATNGGTG